MGMRSIFGLLALTLAGCFAVTPETSEDARLPPEANTLTLLPAAFALPVEHEHGSEPNVAADLQQPPAALPTRELREPTEWHGDRRLSGPDRVAHARTSKLAEVKALFEEAGVAYPPKDTLLRVFKQEAELELWAGGGDEPLRLVTTYAICAASGDLGPKRREGDRQVPEGFYKIGYFDPTSAFHLAMLVDYPNASDRLRGGPQPGGEILIHGSCASIGCVAMSDERIEEIYLVGWATFLNRRPVHVHIFPARDMDALLADTKHEAHRDFWRELKVGHDAFEETKRIPSVRIAADGRYEVD
jgi:murein L,D-transpeptidase YafK